jgi:molecular chaperone HscB
MLAALDLRFRELQAQVHPDKHAHASDTDQRLAMQWATRVNEAYQTLKNRAGSRPLPAAIAWARCPGRKQYAMPMEFLVAQMELREAVADAKVGADDTALDDLRRKLVAEMKQDYQRLQALIDTKAGLCRSVWPGAATDVSGEAAARD